MDIKLPESSEEMVKLIEVVDKHVGETYDNVINVPAKAIGSTISSLIKLVFSPLSFASSKAEIFFENKLKSYQDELQKKASSIPVEKRIEPDIHTVLEAIEHSRFCITNDELRAMFVNLITGTINSETSKFVHPAFAAIIRQMSSKDAKILQAFKNLNCDVTRTYIATLTPEIDEADVNVSLNNLERIGLIKVKYEMDYENLLEVQQQVNFYTERGLSIIEDKIAVSDGNIELTEFGKQFVKVCC